MVVKQLGTPFSQTSKQPCAGSGKQRDSSANYNGRTSDKCPAMCALCLPSCVGQADKWPDEFPAPVNARYI